MKISVSTLTFFHNVLENDKRIHQTNNKKKKNLNQLLFKREREKIRSSSSDMCLPNTRRFYHFSGKVDIRKYLSKILKFQIQSHV